MAKTTRTGQAVKGKRVSRKPKLYVVIHPPKSGKVTVTVHRKANNSPMSAVTVRATSAAIRGVLAKTLALAKADSDKEFNAQALTVARQRTDGTWDYYAWAGKVGRPITATQAKLGGSRRIKATDGSATPKRKRTVKRTQLDVSGEKQAKTVKRKQAKLKAVAGLPTPGDLAQAGPKARRASTVATPAAAMQSRVGQTGRRTAGKTKAKTGAKVKTKTTKAKTTSGYKSAVGTTGARTKTTRRASPTRAAGGEAPTKTRKPSTYAKFVAAFAQTHKGRYKGGALMKAAGAAWRAKNGS